MSIIVFFNANILTTGGHRKPSLYTAVLIDLGYSIIITLPTNLHMLKEA
jgi:hypothetical protein